MQKYLLVDMRINYKKDMILPIQGFRCKDKELHRKRILLY